MKRTKQIRTLLAGLAVAALIGAASCRHAQQLPTNTTNNTRFGWELDNGRRAQISDYKGKVLLLDFYATWCEPCRDETPHLVQLHQRYASQGLQIVGLNVGGEDDHPEVPAFAKEFGIEYPLAIPDDEFVDEYLGLNQNIPQSFIIDRQGRMVKRFVGYGQESAQELDRIVESTLAQSQ
jgi:thiol-disulfide isomerase/thioredoxin